MAFLIIFFWIYLNTEVATVNIVTKEQVPCCSWWSSHFKQLHKIKELPMDVSTDWKTPQKGRCYETEKKKPPPLKILFSSLPTCARIFFPSARIKKMQYIIISVIPTVACKTICSHCSAVTKQNIQDSTDTSDFITVVLSHDSDEVWVSICIACISRLDIYCFRRFEEQKMRDRQQRPLWQELMALQNSTLCTRGVCLHFLRAG